MKGRSHVSHEEALAAFVWRKRCLIEVIGYGSNYRPRVVHHCHIGKVALCFASLHTSILFGTAAAAARYSNEAGVQNKAGRKEGEEREEEIVKEEIRHKTLR